MAPDLIEQIKFFKTFGFDIKLDTNGSNPDLLGECLPLVNYVAMDVKTGFSGYPDLVQFRDTEKINQSVNLLKAGSTDYEFRTTVINPFHTNEQMDEVADIVQGAKRLVLQAFIPRDDLPREQFSLLPRTPSSRLHELKDRMAGCADEILLRGA